MNLEDEIELPSIFESETVIEEAVDTNDKNMKLKNNARFNKAKNANDIDFSEGDKVLHKWMRNNKYQRYNDHGLKTRPQRFNTKLFTF